MHKPALCQNGCMARAGFGQTGFHRPILHDVTRNFGYLNNKATPLCGTLSRTVDVAIKIRHDDPSRVLLTVDRRRSPVDRTAPSCVHRCLQRGGRDTARRAGPSVAAKTSYIRQVNGVNWRDIRCFFPSFRPSVCPSVNTQYLDANISKMV